MIEQRNFDSLSHLEKFFRLAHKNYPLAYKNVLEGKLSSNRKPKFLINLLSYLVFVKTTFFLPKIDT